MDSTTVKPGRCAELPVANKLGQLLVEELDRGTSLDEVFHIVKDMARELTSHGYIQCPRTKTVFENGSDTEAELRILFHTIHRDTLRSLVLGCIAYDFHDQDSENWKNVYSPKGAGSYVVAISIKGRDGGFLSRSEINALSELVEKYKNACVAWSMIDDSYGQSSQVSRQQEELLALAMVIDNELVRKKGQEWTVNDRYREPKCRSGRNGTANAEALIQMLHRRQDENFQSNVPQKQSPVYVGCAHHVNKRSLAHDPGLGSLLGSSSMLKLMLACIRYMGLKPLVHTIPLVMVWKEEQISLSEILVTVLAQSLVTVHGLNIIQPGTNSSMDERNTDHYDDVKEHTWLKRLWFRENIKGSLENSPGHPIYAAVLASMDDLAASSSRRSNSLGNQTCK